MVPVNPIQDFIEVDTAKQLIKVELELQPEAKPVPEVQPEQEQEPEKEEEADDNPRCHLSRT